MNTPNDRRAQLLRIRKMQQKLQLPDHVPPESADLDALEHSLGFLLEIEEEPTSTLSRQLIADGIELPPPDSLDPDETVIKLREIILGLARRHTVLHNTNHLDDRALYRHLWEHTLNEPSHELDDSMGDCCEHIDLIGDGGEDSERIYLQYYAEDFERNEWSRDYPGESLPAKLAPPSDRDRRMPNRALEVTPDRDPEDFPTKWEASAYRHMVAANDFFALGNFKLVHAELDQVEKLDKDSKLQLGVNILRMDMHLTEQNWEQACICGARLCTLAPDEPGHFINHAIALYEMMDTIKALHVLDLAPASAHDDPPYHYIRGLCEVDCGKYDLATQSIRTALSLDPAIRSAVQTNPELAPIRDRLLEDSPQE